MKSTQFLIAGTLLGLTISLHASYLPFVHYFNVDEDIGSDPALAESGWQLAYGSSAIDALTDTSGNVFGGMSLGSDCFDDSTGFVPVADSLQNNDRGFFYFSGSGDTTTGFAPEAFFAYSTDLTTTSLRKGGKTTGTVQSRFATPFSPPEKALNELTLGDLIEVVFYANPRNTATRYHLALQIDGTWYVDSSPSDGLDSWTQIRVPIKGATFAEFPFTPGSQLDLDVSDNATVSLDSFPADTPITGYGVYMDTDNLMGSGDSWCRIDGFEIRALGTPRVQGMANATDSVSVTVDSAEGAAYSLLRDTDLQGTFSEEVTTVSGDGSEITLSDPAFPPSGSNKAFYQIKAEIE